MCLKACILCCFGAVSRHVRAFWYISMGSIIIDNHFVFGLGHFFPAAILQRNERETNVKRVDFESDGNRVMSPWLYSAASDKAAAPGCILQWEFGCLLLPLLTYVIQHVHKESLPNGFLVLSISLQLSILQLSTMTRPDCQSRDVTCVWMGLDLNSVWAVKYGARQRHTETDRSPAQPM